MEKPLVCLDISEGSLKIVIGYNVGGKPVVAYSDSRDVSSYIHDGVIVDKAGLMAAISDMKEVNDPATHFSASVSSGLCLTVPATGLVIYEMSEVTNVVSPENEVARIDVTNLHSKIRKNEMPDGYRIVDIIPDFFVLSNGERYGNPPVGKISPSLSVQAKIHCLPEATYGPISRAIQETGLRVFRRCVAPFCEAEYFKTVPGLPESYLLVDIGYHQTTVSLIGKGSPYGSVSFYSGGQDLSESIADTLDIDPISAERLKKEYGYDTRPCSYDAPIIVIAEEDGSKTKHGQAQLNAAIETFFEEYGRQLSNAVGTLLVDYKNAHETMPMVITGGGSSLFGLDTLLGSYFPRRERFYPEIQTIGARERGFAACLGMILVASRYSGSLVDDYKGVANLSRPRTGTPTKDKKPGIDNDAL